MRKFRDLMLRALTVITALATSTKPTSNRSRRWVVVKAKRAPQSPPQRVNRCMKQTLLVFGAPVRPQTNSSFTLVKKLTLTTTHMRALEENDFPWFTLIERDSSS
mmetsp:Transcript_2292/g.7600  ORF Transcript_2292/g.7600 Transcript_2292/m.7600 type:complete len:105 (+) Transcript_2292:1783-2097(+)